MNQGERDGRDPLKPCGKLRPVEGEGDPDEEMGDGGDFGDGEADAGDDGGKGGGGTDD